MATPDHITEKELWDLNLHTSVPEGGFAGCPWNPKRAPHAWWTWQLAELLDREGMPVEIYGDFGLVGVA